ncbi:MAG: hypothetical protein AAB289_09455, partial [Chloroflexota bacterium]
MTEPIPGLPGSAEIQGVAESGPRADPTVRALMGQLEEMARGTAAFDMTKASRVFLQIMTIALVRVAAEGNWVDLRRNAAKLHKLILQARKLESKLPPAHDPVTLRQEAARQLMQELGSVMTPEEQNLLGGMLQVAADRLQAKRAGIQGAPANGTQAVNLVAPVPLSSGRKPEPA